MVISRRSNVKNNKLPDRALKTKIPGQIYLWIAVIIFGASNAITRKLTDIGAANFTGGHNPISFCNVLFVGNLCALCLLSILYRQQLRWLQLRKISLGEWVNLIVVSILAGAIAPGLIFQSLELTQVNSIILIGRIEPPLSLALSIWLLKERVHRWEIIGAIGAFVGVLLAIIIPNPQMPAVMNMGGFQLGWGEILTAIAAVTLAISTLISKHRLSAIPLGLYSTLRTAIGTIVFFSIALYVYGADHFMEAFSPFLWQWMLIYGGIIIVIGQSFWFKGLRATSVSVATIVSSFTPIAGIIAAYFLLGEVPTQGQYIGGSVLLISIIFSQIGLRQRPHPPLNLASVNQMENDIGFKGL